MLLATASVVRSTCGMAAAWPVWRVLPNLCSTLPTLLYLLERETDPTPFPCTARPQRRPPQVRGRPVCAHGGGGGAGGECAALLLGFESGLGCTTASCVSQLCFVFVGILLW